MSKRLCRKCEKVIPLKIKVEGKTKSLQNRKFCLECSPYLHHNTSLYDPIERRTRTGKKYGEYTEDQKEAIRLSLYKRGLERKQKLIEMSGGTCIECGYKQSRRALSFHHRDRSTKLFGFGLNELWSKTWEKIEEEWQKCDLLCMNCHHEVEDKVEGKGNGIVRRVNAKYGTNF